MATKKAAVPPKGGFGETLKTAVVALAIALFIRTFIVQAFRIPSGSMEDTLLVGDFLLVDKITYGARVPFTDIRLPGLRDPRRGDILVFKAPTTGQDFIKRCIGTGGEAVLVKDDVVYIDGAALTEPYKALKNYPFGGDDRGARFGVHTPLHIPDHALFMMGDNRHNSQDSRYWNALDPRRVVGHAFVIYWSTDPSRAPAFVQSMPQNWVRGLLELVLGRPRITRVGRWIAKDYRDTYAHGVEQARAAADSASAAAAGGPAPATPGTSGDGATSE